MASKRPTKPAAGTARPAKLPAKPASASGPSDPRPTATAEAVAQAASAPPPGPSAQTKAALKKSGISAAMLTFRDNLRERFAGPGAVTAQSAGPSKLGARNVVGTALGVHFSNGRPTGRRGPVVLVATKADLDDVDPAFRIPPAESFGGEKIAVDVLEVGSPRPLFGGFQTLETPPRYGASVGLSGGQTGTYGFRVRRNKPGAGKRPMCALSNAHVLVYDAFANPAQPGPQTLIVHPGDADAVFGGQVEVGELLAYVPIVTSPFQNAAWNTVDAALAWTDASDMTAAYHNDIPFDPEPVDVLHLGMSVIKEGRTTGYTEGVIHQLDVEVNVNYRQSGAPLYGAFSDQIQITGTFGPFSAGGDSGSGVLALVDGVYRPAGLLFAGNGQFTWANPIGEVMKKLFLDQIHYTPDAG